MRSARHLDGDRDGRVFFVKGEPPKEDNWPRCRRGGRLQGTFQLVTLDCQWSIGKSDCSISTCMLTHRGALWASGPAQAGQFVRIILVWR